MLLSNCLLNYAKVNNDEIPLRGSADSLIIDTCVNININLLRKANIKMIERNYLLEINNEQDSIINMKDKYINEQQKIITDFQKRIETNNKISQAIQNDLNKQKFRTKIIGGIAGSIIAGLIVGLLIN